MEGRYYRIKSRFWHDEKSGAWPNDVKLLALYLLTSPHGNMLGCYKLPKLYICADLGWSDEQLAKPFAKLLEEQFIEYDDNSSLILIKRFLKHNPIANENQVKAAASIVAELPRSPLLCQLAEAIKCLISEGKKYLNPLLDAINQQLPKPLGQLNGEQNGQQIGNTVSVYRNRSYNRNNTTPLVDNSGESTPPEPPVVVDNPVDNSKPTEKASLDPRRIMELWNELCGDVLPKATRLTEMRRRKIAARIAESKERTTEDWWRDYFARIRSSPFLCGDGPRGWRADFDWAIRSEQVVVNVFEGKYVRDRPRSQSSNAIADSWEGSKSGDSRSGHTQARA